MKRALLFWLLTLTLDLLTAQFTRSQLQEDLNFLLEHMVQYQPGIRHFNPDFIKKAEVLTSDCKDSHDLFSIYSKVSRLVALAHEGHYSIGNWNDKVHAGFMNNSYSYFPFSVKILKSGTYILENYSHSANPSPGARIHAINGVPIQEILAKLKGYIPADGEIETYLNNNLSEGFSWMYYLFIERPDLYAIEYTDDQSVKHKEIVHALTRDVMVRNYQSSRAGKPNKAPDNNNVYDFYINTYYAVLKLKSFNRHLLEKQELSAEQFYHEVFETLRAKAVKNLIIDLRNNSGGRHEFAYGILPFLERSPSGNLFKTTTSWRGNKKDYTLPYRSINGFKGKIFVLANGNTFSSAASLARYLKEYGDAVIIGEESGSRYQGFAAGSREEIILPHSGITVGIPKYLTTYMVNRKEIATNRGLPADISIEYTIDDLLNHRDLEMRAALELIREHREIPLYYNAKKISQRN